MKRRRPKLTNFLEKVKVDDSFLTLAALKPDDAEFWSPQAVRTRWQALEYLRQLKYGYARCAARMKRVLTVAKLSDPPDSPED